MMANPRAYFLSGTLILSAALCCFATELHADLNVSATGPLYVTGFVTGGVYSVNPQTGAYTSNATIAGNPAGIALANSTTAYVTTFTTNQIYSVNLLTGAASLIANLPTTAAQGISLLNNSTALVAGGSTVNYVNLTTGASTVLLPNPGNGPNFGDVALSSNSQTAYATDFNNSIIYTVNLETGASYVLTTFSPTIGLGSIAVANDTTLYVSSFNNGTIYAVDIPSGNYSLATPTPVGPVNNLIGVALNGTIDYSVGEADSTVYYVNLQTGASYPLVTIAGGPALTYAAFLLQMQTNALSGNNLNLANYLNANAPIDVIRSFALQGGPLDQALESAAPTRNAFSTFASQIGYLSASQTLADHGRQKRFHYKMNQSKPVAAGDIPANELLVQADNLETPCSENSCEPIEKICPPVKQVCKPRYTAWATPFGEYATEKAQRQSPAFSMSSGGGVVGIDYNGENNNCVGLGGAYVYTYVHEDNRAGHASVSQGFLTLYTMLHGKKWYCDFGIWGGHYSSANRRYINFPGVKETAVSTIKGWQVAPHLEIGYDGFRLEDGSFEWFGVEPFIMGDWVGNFEDGFHEHGGGIFNMGQEDRFSSFFRGEGGLRFHETVEFSSGGKLVFREKGSYAYQKPIGTGSITAFLVGSPGSFTVDTLAATENLGVFEFSMLYVSGANNPPYIDIRYQGSFGTAYQSHQAMLEFGKDF